MFFGIYGTIALFTGAILITNAGDGDEIVGAVIGAIFWPLTALSYLFKLFKS